MERGRFLLQAGYLLHQRAYGEQHAILELFTREHGRVGVVARGVRSPRSRRRGILQPFGPLLLSWQARGELGLLTDVEAAPGPVGLRGRNLLCGFYLNELLLRLLRRDDPHPQLYDRYDWTLRALAGDAAEAPTLRVFEKHLLAELGYGLLLEEDISGAPIRQGQLYEYRLEEGPLPVAAPARLSVHGDCLLGLANERLEGAEQLREAKRLMREALAPHLGDRPLKSRELYAQRLRRGPGLAED